MQPIAQISKKKKIVRNKYQKKSVSIYNFRYKYSYIF